MRSHLIITALLIIVLSIFSWNLYRVFSANNVSKTSVTKQTENPIDTSVKVPSQVANLYEPVKDFKQRITKKPFGIFVTPTSSPIKPERFRGYHTGTDSEYGDITTAVPVNAVQDGTVVYSGYVSGYGGVLILTGNINNQPVRFLHGHLNPSQLTPINTTVSANQQIGILGKGYSKETDFERKHLHFAIIKGTTNNFLGYVQNKNELSNWIDPASLNYLTTK